MRNHILLHLHQVLEDMILMMLASLSCYHMARMAWWKKRLLVAMRFHRLTTEVMKVVFGVTMPLRVRFSDSRKML
jgi:hypothetical protein